MRARAVAQRGRAPRRRGDRGVHGPEVEARSSRAASRLGPATAGRRRARRVPGAGARSSSRTSTLRSPSGAGGRAAASAGALLPRAGRVARCWCSRARTRARAVARPPRSDRGRAQRAKRGEGSRTIESTPARPRRRERERRRRGPGEADNRVRFVDEPASTAARRAGGRDAARSMTRLALRDRRPWSRCAPRLRVDGGARPRRRSRGVIAERHSRATARRDAQGEPRTERPHDTLCDACARVPRRRLWRRRASAGEIAQCERADEFAPTVPIARCLGTRRRRADVSRRAVAGRLDAVLRCLDAGGADAAQGVPTAARAEQACSRRNQRTRPTTPSGSSRRGDGGASSTRGDARADGDAGRCLARRVTWRETVSRRRATSRRASRRRADDPTLLAVAPVGADNTTLYDGATVTPPGSLLAADSPRASTRRRPSAPSPSADECCTRCALTLSPDVPRALPRHGWNVVRPARPAAVDAAPTPAASSALPAAPGDARMRLWRMSPMIAPRRAIRGRPPRPWCSMASCASSRHGLARAAPTPVPRPVPRHVRRADSSLWPELDADAPVTWTLFQWAAASWAPSRRDGADAAAARYADRHHTSGATRRSAAKRAVTVESASARRGAASGAAYADGRVYVELARASRARSRFELIATTAARRWPVGGANAQRAHAAARATGEVSADGA